MTAKINQTTLALVSGDIRRCDCQRCQRGTHERWWRRWCHSPRRGTGYRGGMQRNSRQAGRLSHGSSCYHDGWQSSREVRHPHRGGRSGGVETLVNPELLASCYRESLRLAVERNTKTIAFPSISTGVYGYPVAQAAVIALNAVKQFLEAHDGFDDVRFVLFDDATYSAYENALLDV